MKSFRKTLSLFLVVIMLMLLLIPTVSALPTIGSTPTTGNLYIYKYEIKNHSDYSGLTLRADGEEASSIPSSATPYKDVTFTAIKVADISDFNTPHITLPTVADANTTVANMSSSELTSNTYTQTTNVDGFASFSNIPIGIYLVKETNAPSQTITKTADFVVSIPMTKPTGDGWNYDVYVYPKNETKYSSISVHKTGLNNAALSGAVFNLQAQLNGSSTWTTVDTLTTNSSGNATSVSTLPVKTNYRLVETTAPTGYILDHAHKTTTFYINETGDAVKSSSNSTSMGNNNVINISNTKPIIEKYIDKSNGSNTDLVTNTTYGYNGYDYYYYTIKVTTPDVDMTSISNLTVTDTFAKYVANTLSLYSVKKVSNGTTVDSGQYTSTISNGSVTFSFKTGTGSTIEKNTAYYITYRMNLKSAQGTTISNTARLTYSTDTSNSTTTYVDSNTTNMYVGGFQFIKVNPSGNRLSGAKFKIYATEADALAQTNELTCFAPTSPYSIPVGNEFTSISNGIVTISGLYYGDDIDNGEKTYWLVETQAPTGYSLLKAPVAITVNKNSYRYQTTKFEVVNVEKLPLPLTGGIGGMYFFAILSVVLIATGCVVFIVIKKKKTNTPLK